MSTIPRVQEPKDGKYGGTGAVPLTILQFGWLHARHMACQDSPHNRPVRPSTIGYYVDSLLLSGVGALAEATADGDCRKNARSKGAEEVE
jgi:hypothetical protein